MSYFNLTIGDSEININFDEEEFEDFMEDFQNYTKKYL